MNRPAPLAPGAPFTGFTDSLGDVWVALGGVNGGTWRRARDVLYARLSTATRSIIPGAPFTNVTWDTVDDDAYGMAVVGATGHFIVPAGGTYVINGALSVTSAALAYLGCAIRRNGVGFVNMATMWIPEAGTGLCIPWTKVIPRLNANDQIDVQFTASSSLTVTANRAGNFVELYYLGTG
jgi:hypothetical protein